MSAVSARRNPRSYLHELMSVREAHVFKGDRLAAVLRRLSGGVEFRYLPEYLTDEGPSVATTLPLSDEPTLTSAGADPPYFADRDFDQLSFGDLLDAAGVIDPVALAGVQDKMSTRVLPLPVQYAGRRYILKLDTTETPTLLRMRTTSSGSQPARTSPSCPRVWSMIPRIGPVSLCNGSTAKPVQKEGRFRSPSKTAPKCSVSTPPTSTQ